ncbi:MAG TPA: heat-shock protein [Clostridium sp.]|jgi:HSP20 family protein|nr:Hsp20/alpha crystallin family protein [Clostridia bacterium]HCW03488.1 heat-shock protein [Clostridium sp.]
MFEMIPFRRNGLSRRGGEDYFNNFFNSFFNNDFFSPAVFTGSSFKVDMKETEDSYIIEADLPGVPKEAISVEYENNYLTISAKREDTIEDKKDNYLRKERHYGQFKRSFYIDNIDEDQIKARFKDGVLEINLQKLNKGFEKRKRIDIQ